MGFRSQAGGPCRAREKKPPGKLETASAILPGKTQARVAGSAQAGRLFDIAHPQGRVARAQQRLFQRARVEQARQHAAPIDGDERLFAGRERAENFQRLRLFIHGQQAHALGTGERAAVGPQALRQRLSHAQRRSALFTAAGSGEENRRQQYGEVHRARARPADKGGAGEKERQRVSAKRQRRQHFCPPLRRAREGKQRPAAVQRQGREQIEGGQHDVKAHQFRGEGGGEHAPPGQRRRRHRAQQVGKRPRQRDAQQLTASQPVGVFQRQGAAEGHQIQHFHAHARQSGGQKMRSFVEKKRRQHGRHLRARSQGVGKRQHQKRQRVYAHVGVADTKTHHAPIIGAGSMISPSRRTSK